MSTFTAGNTSANIVLSVNFAVMPDTTLLLPTLKAKLVVPASFGAPMRMDPAAAWDAATGIVQWAVDDLQPGQQGALNALFKTRVAAESAIDAVHSSVRATVVLSGASGQNLTDMQLLQGPAVAAALQIAPKSVSWRAEVELRAAEQQPAAPAAGSSQVPAQ